MDNSVRQEPTFKVHDYVLFDCPQPVAIVSGTADEMANRRYIKILRRASGL